MFLVIVSLLKRSHYYPHYVIYRDSRGLLILDYSEFSNSQFTLTNIFLLNANYLQLWDTRMETSPVATYKVHEHLRPKVINKS